MLFRVARQTAGLSPISLDRLHRSESFGSSRQVSAPVTVTAMVLVQNRHNHGAQPSSPGSNVLDQLKFFSSRRWFHSTAPFPHFVRFAY